MKKLLAILMTAILLTATCTAFASDKYAAVFAGGAIPQILQSGDTILDRAEYYDDEDDLTDARDTFYRFTGDGYAMLVAVSGGKSLYLDGNCTFCGTLKSGFTGSIHLDKPGIVGGDYLVYPFDEDCDCKTDEDAGTITVTVQTSRSKLGLPQGKTSKIFQEIVYDVVSGLPLTSGIYFKYGNKRHPIETHSYFFGPNAQKAYTAALSAFGEMRTLTIIADPDTKNETRYDYTLPASCELTICLPDNYLFYAERECVSRVKLSGTADSFTQAEYFAKKEAQ